MFASTFEIDLREMEGVNDIVRWSTAGIDLVDGKGNLYIAAGGLLGIGKVTTENSIKSAPLVVALGGLDPTIMDILGNFGNMRPKVVIKTVTFPEDSNLIQTESVYFRGRGESPEQDFSLSGNNMSITLQMNCYSAFDMSKKMELMRCNNQTHEFYHPGDEMFKYANQDMSEDNLWRAR